MNVLLVSRTILTQYGAARLEKTVVLLLAPTAVREMNVALLVRSPMNANKVLVVGSCRIITPARGDGPLVCRLEISAVKVNELVTGRSTK